MARATHTPAVLRVDAVTSASSGAPVTRPTRPLSTIRFSPAPHQVHPVTTPTPPPPTPAPFCRANHQWPSECYSLTISSLATLERCLCCTSNVELHALMS